MALKKISSIKYDVRLIPQSMDGNCAFACMAMVLDYRKLLDFASFKTKAMAIESIDNCNNKNNVSCTAPGYKPMKEANRYDGFQISPEQFEGIPSNDPNKTFLRNGFCVETNKPKSAKELFNAIKKINGPMIFNSMSDNNINDSHFRVITGMDYCADDADTSDDNDIESKIYINDPWKKGMRKFSKDNPGGSYMITYMDLFFETNKLQRHDAAIGVKSGTTIFFAYHL